MNKYSHGGDVAFKEALINVLREIRDALNKQTSDLEYQQIEQTNTLRLGLDQIQHWLRP